MIHKTIEDYKRHKSFVGLREMEMYFEVTLKSDKDVFGNYFTLENNPTPNDMYKVLFFKGIPRHLLDAK